MSLLWTAEARKQLLPRRPPDNMAPKRPPVGAAWGLVRRALAYHDEIERAFVRGRPDATPPFPGWMEKCEVLARSTTLPSFDDPNVAAVFALLLGKLVNHSLLTSIYPKRGVAFAFEVALRMLAMEAHDRPLYAMERKTPIDPDVSWREFLLPQSDEIRAECKDLAKRMWPSATLVQKTTIAYALFEEAEWAAEVCRESLEAGQWLPAVLYPIVPDLALATELVRKRTQSRSLLELVETFGEAILPALVEVARTPRDDDARFAAEALSLFDDPSAAAAIAPLVKFAGARPFVQAYFARHPNHADALAPVAENKNKAAVVAKELLEGAKRARGDDMPIEATLEELPAIFTSPPWKMKRRPQRPHFAITLTPIHGPLVIAWKPGERERALGIAKRNASWPEATRKTLAAHASAIKRGVNAGFLFHRNQRLPDAATLASWNAGARPYDTDVIERMTYALAKFGESALEGLEKIVFDLESETEDFSFLLRVETPRIAPAMAHLTDSETHARLAWQWLQRHAEVATLGLVPAALGGDRDAESALLRLATTGADVIRIGAPYGDEAKSALEDLLTYDQVYDVPPRIPKLGSSWKPETLTRPVTSAGKALPLAAMDTIGTMLAFSPLDPPYAGIAILKSICTPKSLAEFAWDTARSWENAGHKLREKWMLMSLVYFADADVVRRMTPGIREDFAIDVLERIDTEVALMELLTIVARATKSGDKKVAERVETILDRAASLRSLEKDELEEELAPAKHVEDDGTVSLDYGPRKLRVGFDSSLEPFVLDEKGGRVRALAPARAGDDPERAEQAKALWRDLKEDVAVLAARRIAGLKRAMGSGRKWTADRFRRVWIENGLMKHIARGVVWTDGTTAFRVAEDGSLTNSSDVAFPLARNAMVSVLHPLRTPPDEVDRWRALFADYEILQPFPQLSRAPFERPEKGRAPWPSPIGNTTELGGRLLQHGFERRWHQGKYQPRREVSGGAIAIEISGSDVEIVLEGDPDMVEVADIIDDLQSGAPSSAEPR